MRPRLPPQSLNKSYQFPINRSVESEIGHKAKPYEKEIDLSQPIDPSSSVTNVQVESGEIKTLQRLKERAGFDMLRIAKSPGSTASLITIQKDKEEKQSFSDFLGELREDGLVIPEKVDDVFKRLSGGNKHIEDSLHAYVHQSGVLEPGKSFLQNQLIPVFGRPGDVAVKVESELLIKRYLDEQGHVERIEFERQSRITEIARTIPMEGGQRKEILPNNIQYFGKDGPQVVGRCSIQKNGRVTLDVVDITFAAGEDKSGLEQAILEQPWARNQVLGRFLNDASEKHDKAWAKSEKVKQYKAALHKHVGVKEKYLNKLFDKLVELSIEGTRPVNQSALSSIYKQFLTCDMKNKEAIERLRAMIKESEQFLGHKDSEKEQKGRSNFIGQASDTQRLVSSVEAFLQSALKTLEVPGHQKTSTRRLHG